MARGRVPEHWRLNSWEEKAQENPLFAVMTVGELEDPDAKDFSPQHLEGFFSKGQALFSTHVLPAIERTNLSKEHSFIVEYGCGAGRILNAAVKAGYRCAGIDISPTMLEHCRRLVPEVDFLHLVDRETGIADIGDNVASCVFSYSVLQHIASLNSYRTAVLEMCRILRPGGTLAIQVNSEDLAEGNANLIGRTVNHETNSAHFRHGEAEPYMTHPQDTWSGVYIGLDTLTQYCQLGRVQLLNIYYHNPKKPRAIWVIGNKLT